MGNIPWSNQSWYQQEISIAAAHGIPTPIVDAVIQMESGGKSQTNSIGAAGLLQLLPNGGQGSGYTNAQLMDPVTNLEIGIPYLATAYKAMPAFDNSYNWWYNFGLKSGHVGVPGTEQQSAATAMQNAYNGNLTGGAAGATDLSNKMVTWVKDMYAGSVQKWSGANSATGEQGFDYGVTMNTPIPTIYGGKVVFAGKTDWGNGTSSGGVVVVQTVINGVTNYFYQLHLNSANVKAGDIVNPGDIIGMSGGQTSGGNWNTSTQFTSGPHGEVGFNASFLNQGNVGAALKAQGITVPANFNPISDLTNVADIAASAGGSNTGSSGGNQTTPPPANTGNSTTCAAWDISCIINQFFTSDFFQRATLIFIALVILLIGVLILFFSDGGAQKTAEVAAATA
jgi:Peptidase family M23/Transglycosylase SLT domain